MSWFPEAWAHLGIKNFCQVLTKSFFRERTVIGAQRVPAFGPVIYFGNHSNQFVDAAVFITSLPRYPRFLIAEVSMHAPVIGDLARIAGAIPVTRPGDSQFNGLGVIKIKANGQDENGKFKYICEGDGTAFKTDALKARDQIVIVLKDQSKFSFNVDEVEAKDSDAGTDIAHLIASDGDLDKRLGPKGYPYKIVPKMDQSQAYAAVTKTMADGQCIGIFPEGGSHDNPNLLPLKPGIAVMALTAAAQGIKNIMLVPCGINYSNPAKVMSSYTVEINKPVVITDELVMMYLKDKRAAVSAVMDLVKQRLEEVVVTAGDQEELECIRLARGLYPPEGHVCRSKEVATELCHILERCFREYRERPEIDALLQSLITYKGLLAQYQMKDDFVTLLRLNSSEAMVRTLEALPSFFFSMVIALFTMPLWGPARLVSNYYADMKRSAALKKSTVKIRGSDVVASHKLIFSMILFPVLMTTWSVLYGLYNFRTVGGIITSIILGYLVQPPMYYFGVKEADGLVSKWAEISSLIWIIRHDLVTWRRDTNVLITAREATVLKLRTTLKTLLNEDTPFAQKQKDRLSYIFPEEVIDIDSQRLASNMTNSNRVTTFDDGEVMQDLMGFTEEIL